MTPQEELAALRRMAELEAKSVGGTYSPPAEVVPPKALPQTLAQSADRQTSLLKRSLINAAASPVTMVGGAVNKFINGASSLMGYPTNLQTPQELLDKGMDAGGVAKPEGFVENMAQDVGKSAPAFALPLGKVAQIVGNAVISGATSKRGNEGSDTVMGAAAGALPIVVANALRLGGNAASHTLGMTSGTGAESVKQAFKDAPGFLKNMRGDAPQSEVVDSARQGIDTMRQGMMERYSTAKGGWASDKTPLDFKPIGDAVNTASEKYSFHGVPQPGVADVKVKVEKEVADWLENARTNPAFLTVEGLDGLKRHLSTITPVDATNRTGRAFVADIVDSVKESIIKQRPDYGPAMRDYWASTKELDEITRSLSLGDNKTTDTALRKLQSLMRNNVNSNYGARLQSAGKLLDKGGVDILPQIAGQSMSSLQPRGLQGTVATGMGGASIINPSLALTLPMMMPRVVGEGARYAGKASRFLGAPFKDNDPALAAMIAAALREN